MSQYRPLETTKDDDAVVILKPFYGHIEMATRMRPEGNRWIGEGRSWHYDGDGILTKDTGWQPTGAVLIYPEPEECKPWWQFW